MRQPVRRGEAVTPDRRDVTLTLTWTSAGTATVARALAALSDADLAGPSRLPGWSRRHVIAHLARNAEALSRLLTWARTGVETPMYADADERAAAIESSAQQPPGQLRVEFEDTARDWQRQADELSAGQWAAPVRSARGRPIPAAEVPWMRAREVWLHALDLDADVTVGDLPDDFSTALIDDVSGFFSAAPDCPPMRLVSPGHQWAIGESGPQIDGSAREIAAWLTGRSDGTALRPATRPALPPWL
jgi:maleylpyruvate isomerase